MALFLPNSPFSGRPARLLVAGWVTSFMLLWLASPFVFLPRPQDTAAAFAELWSNGIAGDLLTSLWLNAQANLTAVIISLALAYATVIPLFRPLVTAIAKLRFLPLVGLTFFFTLVTRTGHGLKLGLLVFSITVFFVTSMADVLAAIPREQFDLARTLGMPPWRVTVEVVILGSFDRALDVLRQNAAIGWMMLTMVEGMSREEGGIGALLLNQNKHFHLAAVLAIQLTILALGLGQDWGLTALRRGLCPYAALTTERA